MQTRYQKAQAECAICFERITVQGRLDQCSHIFCTSCISEWAKNENSCPLCKKRFNQISSVSTRPNYSEKSRKKMESGRSRKVERKSQQEKNPFVQLYVNSLQSHEFLNIDQDIQFLSFLLNFEQELNHL